MSKTTMIALCLCCLGNLFVQEAEQGASAQEARAQVEVMCLNHQNIDPKQLKIASDFVDTPATNPYLDTSERPKDPYRRRLLAYLYTVSVVPGRIPLFKLRAGVIKYHTCFTVSGHYLEGTDVYYLPKEKVFFLNGGCAMNHFDGVVGPFVGDPRVILPKVAVPDKGP